MTAQVAIAYKPYAENLWSYVKSPGQRLASEDRDRAVEYCRRYAVDVKVFKLVMMGIGVITNHVRKTNKEALYYMADFTLDPFRSLTEDSEGNKRVSMWFEVQAESSKGVRRRTPDRRYELLLVVNPNGYIIDVDFKPLMASLFDQFQKSYPAKQTRS